MDLESEKMMAEQMFSDQVQGKKLGSIIIASSLINGASSSISF
jgi:hypothetical protein